MRDVLAAIFGLSPDTFAGLLIVAGTLANTILIGRANRKVDQVKNVVERRKLDQPDHDGHRVDDGD